MSDRALSRFSDRAAELLDEVGLGRHRDVEAGTLAYGQKRALELALALALDPKVADRVTVLQFGQVLVEGTYDEVRGDSRVIDAYLGGESAA